MMSRKPRASGILVAIAIAAVSSSAHARKFNFDTERLATYFRGSYGLSRVGDTPYAGSSGDGVAFDKSVSANAGGEIGILFAGGKTNLRLGAELAMPRNYSDIKGSDASGKELYVLDSKVMALIPSATLEIILPQSPTSRLLLGAGGGVGFVTLDNTYKMTADGTAAFPGIGDHAESATARVTSLHAYVGYEVLFTDTVTAAFDIGYRHMPVTVLKSTKDVTTFTGTETTGGDLKNHGGGNRTIDLSEFRVGIGFRFYLGL